MGGVCVTKVSLGEEVERETEELRLNLHKDPTVSRVFPITSEMGHNRCRGGSKSLGSLGRLPYLQQ